MPDYSAGSASVRIRPNADDFVRDLEAKLKAVHDPGYDVSVHADFTAADREFAEWKATHGSRGVDVDVDADTGGASSHMVVWRREEESRPINVEVHLDTSKADRELLRVKDSLNRFTRSDFAWTNLGAGVLAGIQPAIAGLAEFAVSLQDVAQAGLIVPGALSGVGASIGTLALGVSGVSGAWKALSQESAKSGKDQATAARTAQQASQSLRNTLVDEAQARKDVVQAVRDARNEYRDLNIEMRGGMLNEQRAILGAQQARERLARGQYSDLRDAILDVAESDQRVLEVRQRNSETSQKLNDANQKGIALNDGVVSANERLTRSQQSVANSQQAVADSSTKATSAQTKAAQALAALSPNARQFLETLHGMIPAFQDFRSSISQPLFAGKAEEFKHFFATVEPVASRGMAGIATAWNHNITALQGSLSDTQGLSLIDRILGNTGNAQERATAAIDPIVKAVGTLSAAGSDKLPRLADGLTKVSERFRDFIIANEASGDLDKWMDRGITAADQLGNSALNVAKSFTDITKAARDEGGRTFLQWLQDATGHMHAFLSSAEGQNKIREVIREGKEEAEKFKPLLEELPGLFKSLMEAGQTYMGGMLPLLTNVAKLLNDHPDLVKVAIAAYAGWQTVKPFISIASTAISGLETAVTGVGTRFYDTRDKAKNAMADVDNTFKKAGHEGSGLKGFAKGLSAVGGPVGTGAMGLLAAVGIPALVTAFDAFEQKSREAEKVTDDLRKAQEDLEITVDRVTGKLTDQSRDKLIQGAQNYDTTGRPGGGVQNISKGDALAAANRLGIAPDVYADALVGKPDAIAKVRDVLMKNNLAPEVAANQNISNTTKVLGQISGGAINQDLLTRALLGDPDAVKAYTDQVGKVTQDGRASQIQGGTDLTSIAKQLSPTGQASVLSGGYLNDTIRDRQGVGGPTQQANQAKFGRFRVRAGQGGIFPDNAQVNSSGSDYKVVVPGSMRAQLDAQKIAYTVNPSDGSLTATLPLDSPFIENYDRGGPTPASKGPLDAKGGWPAVVHPEEYIANARGRAVLGDEFLRKANMGMVDISTLPHFDLGGFIDQYGNPVTPGMDPGPTSPVVAPVAPNPTAGGINNIASSFTSGLQGTIGNLASLGQNLTGQQQGTDASQQQLPPTFSNPRAAIPGLWGLANAQDDQDVQAWQQQTGSYMANWGAKTLSSFGNTMLSGVLGFFGLDALTNSDLFKGITGGIGQGVSYFSNLNNSIAAADQAGLSTDALGGAYPNDVSIDATGHAVPGTGNSVLNTATQASSLGGANTTYSPSLLASKGIAPLFQRIKDANGNDVAQIPDWTQQLASAYGLSVTSHVDTTLHGNASTGGWAFDFSGKPEDMQRFAEFLHSDLAPQTLQEIWQNPSTGQQIGVAGGQTVGPNQYYTGSQGFGAHTDHVHWATDVAPNLWDANGNPLIPGLAAVSPRTTPTATAPGSAAAPSSSGAGTGWWPSSGGLGSGFGGVDLTKLTPAAPPPAPAPAGPRSPFAGRSGSGMRYAAINTGVIAGLTGRFAGMGGSGSVTGSNPSSFPFDTAVGIPGGVDLKALTMPLGSAPASGKGAEQWRPLVRQMVAKYGPTLGITNLKAWEDAIIRQINTESGGNANVGKNLSDSNAAAGHPSEGLLQFIPSTFAANNITGGAFTDPAAQIAALLPYVVHKYGMGPDGSPNRIGRGIGYSQGGAARGPGGPKGDKIPAMLSDDEHVFTAEDVDAMGGQANVYAFRHALHRALGGEITQGLVVPPPPRPNFQAPNVIPMRPRPAPRPAPAAPQPAPQAPAPAPQAPPTAAPPAAPPQPATPKVVPATPVAPGPQASDTNSGINHNLPWVSTAIKSTASTLGNLAATAASVAAMGMGGGGGGGGAGGGMGAMISGLFQQGGKIADAAANVVSSALVGSVPGSFGDAAKPYGELQTSNIPRPATAEWRGGRGGNTYNMFGHDTADVLRYAENKEALDRQARLATVRG